ncbi:MAG: argininosuccinate synthase [Vampirovibrionales bacterium]
MMVVHPFYAQQPQVSNETSLCLPSPEQLAGETIILAYSGGLDTSTILPWLKEQLPESKLVAVCVNVGMAHELEGLEARALQFGADVCEIIDVQETFVQDYIFPCLKAGAKYEQQYLLGTAMARPLIAKTLVEVAQNYQAKAICHGATGKGNDQVRFELSFKALAPELTIIAPWRHWHIASREDAMHYLQQKGLPIPFALDKTYSRDMNLWHLSHEGQELESPHQAPNYAHMLQWSQTPQTAPDLSETIALTFQQGVPVALNGEAMAGVTMIQTLNALGAKHGIGILDMLENRVVGLKSRGVYETPGGTILYQALACLEQLCLDRTTLHHKHVSAITYANLVYEGQWFTPLREALDAFVQVLTQCLTGTVTLTLYKGNILPAGVVSPYSLY